MIPYLHVPDLRIGGESGISLHPFGILVATGVLLGTALTTRRAKKLGYDVALLNSFITWMLLAGFIGAHVFDQIFYEWDQFKREPYMIFALWTSLSSFGGFLGALTGIVLWKYFKWGRFFFRRREQPMPILPYADLVLSVFPVAWIFGRSGCSLAHDHPGHTTDASDPLGVSYPPDNVINLHTDDHWPVARICEDPGISKAGPFELVYRIVPKCVVKDAAATPGLEVHGFPKGQIEPGHIAYQVDVDKVGPIDVVHGVVTRYDLGLLELMFTVILAACIVITWRYKVKTGTYVIVTALSYAPVRFVLDFLRRDDGSHSDARYASLTPAQWLCVALFAFGLAMTWKVLRTKKDPADRVRVAATIEPAAPAEPQTSSS